jgi:hypothetical protein
MQPSQTTFVKRWHRWLAAIIAAGAVLLFAIATTQAVSTRREHRSAPASRLAADRIVPAAPAGPQGPIELACRAGRVSVTRPDGPAGPQGPVVTACGSTAQR